MLRVFQVIAEGEIGFIAQYHVQLNYIMLHVKKVGIDVTAICQDDWLVVEIVLSDCKAEELTTSGSLHCIAESNRARL